MGAYLSSTHFVRTGHSRRRARWDVEKQGHRHGKREHAERGPGERNVQDAGIHTRGRDGNKTPRAPGGRRELAAWMRGTGARLVGCAPQAALLGGSADLAVCAESDVGWVSIVKVGAGCVPVWSMSCRVLPPLVLVLCSVSRSGSWACELSVLVECELDF